MIAVNGAVLLLFGALLVAMFYALRSTPRARREPSSIVMTQPADCDITSCPHIGTLAVRRGDETVRVCVGHHDEGYLRGWWTPKTEQTPDPTRDRTGAAL